MYMHPHLAYGLEMGQLSQGNIHMVRSKGAKTLNHLWLICLHVMAT